MHPRDHVFPGLQAHGELLERREHRVSAASPRRPAGCSDGSVYEFSSCSGCSRPAAGASGGSAMLVDGTGAVEGQRCVAGDRLVRLGLSRVPNGMPNGRFERLFCVCAGRYAAWRVLTRRRHIDIHPHKPTKAKKRGLMSRSRPQSRIPSNGLHNGSYAKFGMSTEIWGDIDLF